MDKMGNIQRNWLKGFHILLASIWIGEGFTMIWLMNFNSQQIGAMYSIWSAIKEIDVLFVAIPDLLTLITGLLLTSLTHWGFKHLWIKVKLFINLTISIIGGTFMRNLVDGQQQMLKTNDPSVLQNPIFSRNTEVLINSTLLIMLAVIFALFISVIKPWGRSKSETNRV